MDDPETIIYQILPEHPEYIEDAFGTLVTLPEHRHFIQKILQLFRENDLKLIYKCIKTPEDYTTPQTRVERNIYVMKDDDVVGDFRVESTVPRDYGTEVIDSGSTMSLGISVNDDDYPELKGQGIARLMVGMWCYCITQIEGKQIRHDQLLAIDADGSAGFWKYIGMVENTRAGYDRLSIAERPKETGGNEKVIEFRELSKWATQKIFSTSGGGIKHRKTCRKRKRKTCRKRNKKTCRKRKRKTR